MTPIYWPRHAAIFGPNTPATHGAIIATALSVVYPAIFSGAVAAAVAPPSLGLSPERSSVPSRTASSSFGNPSKNDWQDPTSDIAAGPITAEDAVRFGLARNPEIAAGEAGAAAGAASYRSLSAFPSLNLGITRVTGSSTNLSLNSLTTDTDIDLGDVVDTSGQRRFQAAGGKAQLDSAIHQLRETRLALAQQIRDAYWTLAAARAQVRLGIESMQEVQRSRELTRLQHAAGAAPAVDVVRSGIDVANANQSYVASQWAERTAAAALNVLLVRPPASPLELAETFSEDMTENPRSAAGAILGSDLPDLSALVAAAHRNRPAVQSAAALVTAAEYSVKQAKAARYPDLSVDYYRSVQSAVQSVVLGVRLPILDFGSTRNTIAAAEQTRRQALAQLQQQQQQAAQQVAQAYNDFQQAKELASSYRTEIVLPSVSLLNTAQTGYRQGATGILPVIDAETTLRNARTGYINTVLALYKALDEVEAATGTSLQSLTKRSSATS